MSAWGIDSTEIQARAAKIRCLFSDIDGVMTDCKPYLTLDGGTHFTSRGDGAILEAAGPIFAAQGRG